MQAVAEQQAELVLIGGVALVASGSGDADRDVSARPGPVTLGNERSGHSCYGPRVLALFIGTIHLFLMLNAGVRSVAGKFWIGCFVAVARIVLLMAVSMAFTRIRVGGVEATPAITIAIYAGPALTVATCALAYARRRKMAAGSEDDRVAEIVMRAWLAAAVMDVIFVAVNITRIMLARS